MKFETIDACIWGLTSPHGDVPICADADREVVVPAWAKDLVRKIYKEVLPSRKIPQLKFVEAKDPRSFGGLWLPDQDSLGGGDGRGRIAVFAHPDHDYAKGVLIHECCHDLCQEFLGDDVGHHDVDFLRLVEVLYIDCKIPAHVARKIEAKSPSTKSWSW